jgi:hypothetical protein
MAFTIWTAYTANGILPDRDAKLDQLAAPGTCINSGYSFGEGLRDREYEFEKEEDARAAADRVEGNGYQLIGDVEEKQ